MRDADKAKVLGEDGNIESIDWKPEWGKIGGLPPDPGPLYDCATITLPNNTLSCDTSGCRAPGECKMYSMDLNNPGEDWVVEKVPVTPQPNHVYLCRCTK